MQKRNRRLAFRLPPQTESSVFRARFREPRLRTMIPTPQFVADWKARGAVLWRRHGEVSGLRCPFFLKHYPVSLADFLFLFQADIDLHIRGQYAGYVAAQARQNLLLCTREVPRIFRGTT